MKKIIFATTLIFMASFIFAQDTKNIALKTPQLKKGLPLMQAFNNRKSVREFSDKELDNQTLSNLLWATTGVNRPDGKRTNPTAMNKQEIEIYACLKSGAYFYNVTKHSLEFISDKDCRLNNAPVTLYITADMEKSSERWANIDAGIVSQNISLFASGMGLATVPRGSMDQNFVKEALKLGKNKILILNHPIGYPKTENKVSK
ncbi:Nitroreductase [Elusimicrobium minutum Pei191]|uniref:Nitroreductase n=1 Tax=Elusimicrobium minutum (strain Pei191) TaxID=445932 RepID=B2KB20_ELUMP|nr:SagB/ThcOx family dehydrogenase [Elusimicrobium minutum]ACC97779.1 Nitroreductase [Elusimicrobium minutum Pei191]